MVAKVGERGGRVLGVAVVTAAFLLLVGQPRDAAAQLPADPPHDDEEGEGYLHARNKRYPYTDHCTDCHAPDLGGGLGPSCFQCHDEEWWVGDAVNLAPPLDHTDLKGDAALHGPGAEAPVASGCTLCHGPNLHDGFAPSCFSCHTEATGTPHDFSRRSWLAPADTACTPCHDWGTWNHAVSPTSGYTVSTTTASTLGDPTGTSALCLGCHEGNVAVDSYGGNTGTEFITGAAAFGTDLSRHHPVSFFYDSLLAAVQGGLNDPATTPSGLPAGGTIAEDMLEAGQLQCASCHDQHDNTNGKFLVKTPDGGLCFTCHTRHLPAGTTGRHHIPRRDDPWASGQCTLCHGANLEGSGSAPACLSCHGPFSFPDPPPPPEHHGGDRNAPLTHCVVCHADNDPMSPSFGMLVGAPYGVVTAPSCGKCHVDRWSVPAETLEVDMQAAYAGNVDEAMTFTAAVALDRIPQDNQTVTFEWRFGDGAPPPLPVTITFDADTGTWDGDASATHVFTAPATYAGSVTVTAGSSGPVVAEFDVTIEDPSAVPEEVDRWHVITTQLEEFDVTFQNAVAGSAGVFTAMKVKDGTASVALGIEVGSVIFWIDIEFGPGTWGVGNTYFGNIRRGAGTMSGIVFTDAGGVANFSGTANP